MTTRFKARTRNFFLSTCWLFSTTSFAATDNPPDSIAAVIYDKKPNCIAETLTPLALTITSKNYPADTKPLDSEAVKSALVQLRQQASDKGADAILLTNVSNHILSKMKQKKLSQRSSQESSKVTQLRTYLEA